MKITKRQLKRIIKEEKAKVLAEQKIRRRVRRRLMEQAGQGLVLIPGFTNYVAPLSPDGLDVADSGHRELPPGPWLDAWDNEDTPAVVAELSKLGVTHIGGDDGDGIADMLGLPGSVVTLAQFAKAFS